MNMFCAVTNSGKLYVEVPFLHFYEAKKALDALELRYKFQEGGFFIEIPQHIIARDLLYDFAHIIVRVIQAVIEHEREMEDVWITVETDHCTHHITRKQVWQMIEDFDDASLNLLRSRIEEEVRKRQTSLSK